MPITLAQIASHCDSLGLKTTIPPDQSVELGIRFGTRSYIDSDGDHSLLIICKLDEDGRYLEVYAPQALNSSKCKYKAALFSCMLHITFMTRHLQLEHDPEDGEVRFAIDLPVADGTVTAEQLEIMIRFIVICLEEYYPVLKHAMETGKIDYSLRWQPASEEPAPPPSLPPELQALLDQVGGLDKLEALVEAQRKEGKKS